MSTSLDYEAARQAMINSQLRPNRLIDERLIEAIDRVPREAFVPKELRGIAYVDEDLPLGEGRYMMEPMVLARMLQDARIEADDTVLMVGCTTGYGAAVAAALAGTVIALEQDPEFVRRATETLAGLGIANVAVVEGELAQGIPDQGPFDVIILEGAVAEVPETLLDQLAEGGRLMTVLREGGIGKLTIFTRVGGIGRRTIFDAATPVLPGFEKKKSFVF
ncbi:protein-L-isoaspartate O-methyltransferase family protein [Minwuia thermotolerans]|uniref:protein-L-isoaspartate O-methyltransferase family protein n=1 Tax=Minwuia thermotolerans TaxID=2056226 RepID=UPI0019D0D318|nr:protein-L-isoaspartate O-methyltransferase [Minwuia thermotolerans]